MKFSLSQKWVIILLTVILPALLLGLAIAFGSNICAFMAVLLWIGMVLIMAFIPYYKESP